MIKIPPTEMNISSWLFASLTYDPIRPLENKLYADENRH